MLGATTIGNATLIAYEDKPILATDPWLGDEDPAYFGSWGLSHRIPAACRRDIMDAEYIWFSHGHPDHFNDGSLRKLKGKHIMLGDHVGGRIAHYLREEGFEVTILPDREWVQLSPRIKVFCITTWIQDSILLIDVGGRLFVNLNDAGDCDCTLLLRRIIAQYQYSYLLVLFGSHDADMINFYTEDGTFILPPAFRREPMGERYSAYARRLGTKSVIPFSSFHRYQRTDSLWAQEYARSVEEYSFKFDHQNVEFIPPFSHINCENGEVTPLDPPEANDIVQRPEDFGDNWSDELERGDLDKIAAYFRQKELVRDNFTFMNFRVGGKDNFFSLDGKQGRGLTFEVPRTSLMTAVEYEIFDDLLIGNFMKTTMHNVSSLYDHGFAYAVAKWGDNGRAFTHAELAEYISEYKKRSGRDWYFSRYYQYPLREFGMTARRFIPSDGPIYNTAQRIYRMLM